MGRRLRRLEPAPAAGVGRRGGFSSPAGRPWGEPAVRHGAARERGRRRSAYEAPHGSVAPGPVSSGAESKRRRRPRSRARTSRVTLLIWSSSLPRRPAGAAEQLRLPAIAVAQPFLHPAAGPGGRLALGEQARELGPVLDLLEQDDLVVAARAGRDGPARRDRDHARAARLRIER